MPAARKEAKTRMMCQFCKREVEPLKTPFRCPHCGTSMFNVKLGGREPLWKPGSVYEHREPQRELKFRPGFADYIRRRVNETFGQWLRRQLRYLMYWIRRLLEKARGQE